jgi:16S rRNA (guanine966-N2)-methyltransferase
MRILGGEFKGRVLPTLEDKGCRPAMAKVRLALFSMLEARGVTMSGATVLDVFAGTGSLGFEALSRGARLAWFLEKNKTLARRIQENCGRLELPRGSFRILCGESQSLLSRQPAQRFNVVFVDPPYGQDLLAPALELLITRQWLAPEAMVVAELEKDLELSNWPAALVLDTDRAYGQTRICLWRHDVNG